MDPQKKALGNTVLVVKGSSFSPDFTLLLGLGCFSVERRTVVLLLNVNMKKQKEKKICENELLHIFTHVIVQELHVDVMDTAGRTASCAS